MKTFKERFEYLKLGDKRIGEETFGYDRFLNQVLYHSAEWKKARNIVILRDECCDMGLNGFNISGRIYIHHINPITREHIRDNDLYFLTDPDNLVCVSYDTHQAIHWGSELMIQNDPVERRPYDTCPWR